MDVSELRFSFGHAFETQFLFGLLVDISLYKDESQIEKKGSAKRKRSDMKERKTPAKDKEAKHDDGSEAEDGDDDSSYEPSKKRPKSAAKKSTQKKVNVAEELVNEETGLNEMNCLSQKTPKAAAAPPAAQTSPSKTNGKAKAEEKSGRSTPKLTKQPVKRKLIEKVDDEKSKSPTKEKAKGISAVAIIVRPVFHRRSFLSGEKTKADGPTSPKVAKTPSPAGKSSRVTTPTSTGSRTTRSSRT